MATYHLEVENIGRGVGRSVVAAAAYRRATLMEDQRTGLAHDYRAKGGHMDGGLVGWADAAAALWNAVEAGEKHPRAILAREIRVALPHELDDAGRRRVTAEFAGWLRARHGVAVQWDIHRPKRPAEADNPHAHLLLTTRRVGPDGRLGAKTRELDCKGSSAQHITDWRAEWERTVNAELTAAGSTARVDCRSLRARAQANGLPVPEAMERLGPSAAAMERRGVRTKAGERNRRRRARNREREQLTTELRELIAAEGRWSRHALRRRAEEAVTVFRDQSRVHPRPVLDRALAYRAMLDAAHAAWGRHWAWALRLLLRRMWPQGRRVTAGVGLRLAAAGCLSHAQAAAAAFLADTLVEDRRHEDGREGFSR